MASRDPVEAPEGTAARPITPDSSSTSHSTVGLPRESRISRATTSTTELINFLFLKILTTNLQCGATGRDYCISPKPVFLTRRSSASKVVNRLSMRSSGQLLGPSESAFSGQG